MKISNEVKIGILATITIFGAIWGYKFLKGQNFLSTDQHFHAYYNYADQLDVSAPVYVKGLEVGTVTQIKFVPGKAKEIRVEFQVDNKIKVPDSSIAYIISTGLLGGKAIELDIPGPCTGEECAESGDALIGRNRNIITSMLGEEDLEKSIDQLSTGLMKIIDSLDKALSQSEMREGIGSMVNDVQNTLANVSELTASLNETVGNANSNFNRSMDNIASITNNLKQNNARISNIVKNVEAVSTDLKEAEVGNTFQKANDAIDQTKGTLSSLESRLDDAKQSIDGLNKIVQDLERGEGTLGKLLQSEDVYNNLQKSSKNLELLLQDIRLNPNRYIKVSVFGKKSDDYQVPEDDPAYFNGNKMDTVKQ
jgi:phospholipid/cholesterol/gamma-HCH transport system substrate-binding protein